MTHRRCRDCTHHGTALAEETKPVQSVWWCGHYDLLELDSNDPGRRMGLSDRLPEWCPLTEDEQAKLPQCEDTDWPAQLQKLRAKGAKSQKELFPGTEPCDTA
jgi:hypothetical protein